MWGCQFAMVNNKTGVTRRLLWSKINGENILVFSKSHCVPERLLEITSITDHHTDKGWIGLWRNYGITPDTWTCYKTNSVVYNLIFLFPGIFLHPQVVNITWISKVVMGH